MTSRLLLNNGFGIKDIKDSKIIFNDNNKVVILKVLPINFKLKSKLEQKAILNEFQMFLKNLNSKIQIIISSKKTDISYHIDEILKSTNENLPIKEISEDYILFLKQMINERGSITKEFYIALNDEPNIENGILKIKEYLANCGNEVEKCTDEEINLLIKNYINKRQLV